MFVVIVGRLGLAFLKLVLVVNGDRILRNKEEKMNNTLNILMVTLGIIICLVNVIFFFRMFISNLPGFEDRKEERRKSK